MFDYHITALLTCAIQMYIFKQIRKAWKESSKREKKEKDIKNGKI